MQHIAYFKNKYKEPRDEYIKPQAQVGHIFLGYRKEKKMRDWTMHATTCPAGEML